MYHYLNLIMELVYDKCGFELTNLNKHTESVEYEACSFELNGKKIQFRSSKITPTKTGQFVTIWKRDKYGETAPFDISDNLDYIIILSKSGDNFGQFIFPATVLTEKGIIANNSKAGKRGIRVYPPWDTVTNKQAKKTQEWQTMYFFSVGNTNSSNIDLIKKLF